MEKSKMAESPAAKVAETPTAGRAPRPVRVPVSVLHSLKRAAESGYPHESCGLLVGEAGAEGVRVVRMREARNLAVDRLRDRYTLAPADFLAADAEARAEGLDIVGIWHSHPDHPSRPSATDRDAAWQEYTYLIISVRRGAAEDVMAWALDGGTFVEQPIEEIAS
jgi:proteasome lid subunit RPN8/RPN11